MRTGQRSISNQDSGYEESQKLLQKKKGRKFNEVFKEVYTFPPLSHAILGGRGEVNDFFPIISEQAGLLTNEAKGL